MARLLHYSTPPPPPPPRAKTGSNRAGPDKGARHEYRVSVSGLNPYENGWHTIDGEKTTCPVDVKSWCTCSNQTERYQYENALKIDDFVDTYVTFGVVIYSRAGSLIPIRLWVFTCVSYVVIATHAGRAGTMCAAIWRTRRFRPQLSLGVWRDSTL